MDGQPESIMPPTTAIAEARELRLPELLLEEIKKLKSTSEFDGSHITFTMHLNSNQTDSKCQKPNH